MFWLNYLALKLGDTFYTTKIYFNIENSPSMKILIPQQYITDDSPIIITTKLVLQLIWLHVKSQTRLLPQSAWSLERREPHRAPTPHPATALISKSPGLLTQNI